MQMIFGSSKAPVADIDALSLSGTVNSPRFKVFQANAGQQALVSWLIGCNDASNESILSGQVQRSGVDPTANPGTEDFASVDTSTDWVIPIGFVATYYVRATKQTGSNPTQGDLLDTWLTLAPGGANRVWSWKETVSGNNISGTLKIEIAEDSGGVTILATGYYRGSAVVRSEGQG